MLQCDELRSTFSYLDVMRQLKINPVKIAKRLDILTIAHYVLQWLTFFHITPMHL